jgi:hypothetical protein
LLTIPLPLLLKYHLNVHFVEKCLLFQPIYFKIFQKSSLSIDLANTMTGTRLVLVGPGHVGPGQLFAKLIDNEVFWYILKYIGWKSKHFSTKWTFKWYFNNKGNGMVSKSFTGTRNFFWSRCSCLVLGLRCFFLVFSTCIIAFFD